MSDWQPGDLALCVNAGFIPKSNGGYATGAGLRKGAIYRVRECGMNPEGAYCLWLHEIPKDVWGRRSSRFIKITPGAKIEGIEETRRIPVKERQDA